jgi:hypothetical protein
MTTFHLGAFDDRPGPEPAEDATWAAAQAGGQLCLFCLTEDWRWFRHLGATAPDAAVTLPQFVVTCEVCERLLVAGDQAALAARAEAADPGESDELLSFFDQVVAAAPRPRTDTA